MVFPPERHKMINASFKSITCSKNHFESNYYLKYIRHKVLDYLLFEINFYLELNFQKDSDYSSVKDEIFRG